MKRMIAAKPGATMETQGSKKYLCDELAERAIK
jgi:hypothetical protein